MTLQKQPASEKTRDFLMNETSLKYEYELYHFVVDRIKRIQHKYNIKIWTYIHCKAILLFYAFCASPHSITVPIYYFTYFSLSPLIYLDFCIFSIINSTSNKYEILESLSVFYLLHIITGYKQESHFGVCVSFFFNL